MIYPVQYQKVYNILYISSNIKTFNNPSNSKPKNNSRLSGWVIFGENKFCSHIAITRNLVPIIFPFRLWKFETFRTFEIQIKSVRFTEIFRLDSNEVFLLKYCWRQKYFWKVLGIRLDARLFLEFSLDFEIFSMETRLYWILTFSVAGFGNSLQIIYYIIKFYNVRFKVTGKPELFNIYL